MEKSYLADVKLLKDVRVVCTQSNNQNINDLISKERSKRMGETTGNRGQRGG